MKYALVVLAFVPLVLIAGTEYLAQFAVLLVLTLGALRLLEFVDGDVPPGEEGGS